MLKEGGAVELHSECKGVVSVLPVPAPLSLINGTINTHEYC